MKGTVVRKRDEGYGFIKPEEGEKDVFFHASAVAEDTHFDDIKEGAVVTFDIVDGPKGPAAENVQLAADAAPAAEAAPEAANDNEAPAEGGEEMAA